MSSLTVYKTVIASLTLRFVWFLEQTVIIPLDSMKRLVSIMQKPSFISCDVETRVFNSLLFG